MTVSASADPVCAASSSTTAAAVQGATNTVAPGGAATLSALISEVQRGDEDAFRELYDLTAARAMRVATAVTRSPEHAADVVQETYLWVWQHARCYDPSRASVLGWVLMITHRRAVDRVRAVARAAERDRRDHRRNSSTVPDVAELSIARHEASAVRVALRRLSQVQHDAVALTYLHGHTHQEAALLLGVPLGTLKSRVRDGVRALRAHVSVEAA